MTFTYDDMAKYYGTSRTTFWRHLKKISFKKSGKGDFFNEVDAEVIAKQLGFSIPPLNISAKVPQTEQKQPELKNQIDLEDSIKDLKPRNRFM